MILNFDEVIIKIEKLVDIVKKLRNENDLLKNDLNNINVKFRQAIQSEKDANHLISSLKEKNKELELILDIEKENLKELEKSLVNKYEEKEKQWKVEKLDLDKEIDILKTEIIIQNENHNNLKENMLQIKKEINDILMKLPITFNEETNLNGNN